MCVCVYIYRHSWVIGRTRTQSQVCPIPQTLAPWRITSRKVIFASLFPGGFLAPRTGFGIKCSKTYVERM